MTKSRWQFKIYKGGRAFAAAYLFPHEDITGKRDHDDPQTRVKELPNVEIREYTVMTDILVEKGICTGILVKNADGDIF